MPRSQPAVRFPISKATPLLDTLFIRSTHSGRSSSPSTLIPVTSNIGTTTGNTIGATSGGGGAPASIYTATTGDVGGVGPESLLSTANTVTIQNNTLGSIDASGTSATTAGGFLGIQTQGGGGVVTTSNNTIGSATLQNIRIGYMTTTGVAGGPLSNAGILTSTTTATAGTLIGIANSATGAPLNITANTMRNLASSVSHTGLLNGSTRSWASLTKAPFLGRLTLPTITLARRQSVAPPTPGRRPARSTGSSAPEVQPGRLRISTTISCRALSWLRLVR